MKKKSGFGTVTFSVMATRSHQVSSQGISTHRFAASWELRRALCLSYMGQGGFDFIGLKHCHYQPGTESCALSYFLAGLDCDLTPWGTINAVIRPKPQSLENGDTLSILYRRDIWEVDTQASGPVWHKTPPPQDQPGGHGNVFNYAVFRRIHHADGVRPERLHVYNIRMRDKHTTELDIYRALCFGEICAHIKDHIPEGAPVILLCDTNCKVIGSICDKLLMHGEARIPGLKLYAEVKLQDSYIDLYPEAHGSVRTQHNFVSPNEVNGKERNNRVLYCGNIKPIDACISTWSGGGGYMPSYHYPVEGWFKITT